MKRFIHPLLLLALLVFLVSAGCSQATSTPEVATAAPSSTPIPEATLTPAPAATSSEALLAPGGVLKETYYAPFPLPITLDGDLSDWEGVPRFTIPEEAEQYPNLKAMTFAAAADDTHIYFMADVIDDNIISGQHGTDYWNEDSVEFYVNATGDLSLTSYRDGVAQITIPPLNIGLNPEETVVGGVRSDTAGAQVAAVKTERGYVVEVAVPLKNDVWKIRREHGDSIGFQVHLNGASTANRDLKLIWSAFDKADKSYQNPSVFGKLIFFEIGQTQVAEAEPTPRPTSIPVPADAAYKNADLPIVKRVADLLDRMTLEEKIGQMTLVEKNSIVERDITHRYIGGLLSGGGGYPETNTPEAWAAMVDGFQEYALQSRLGIPLIYGVDAVHGHNNVYSAVIYPHNVGLGAAGDPELMARIGRTTAAEMTATGIYWNYAPAVSIPQDIRWGRTYEGYSENAELVSTLATAYLRGLQGDDLADPDTVLATPKHFVGDGGTAWGSSTTPGYQIDQGVTEVDEATLRAVHLPPYAAVIEAGARSIMISYSSWGGMKMHAQKYLISDLLKGELGFEGFVVSDWGGIDQITDDYYEAVVAAINAGIDMNMVPYEYGRFIDTLTEAVENGDVPLERIDDAVRRILSVKFEMGLFDHPFSNEGLLAEMGSEEHRAVAREAVSRSLVLLKNDGDTLPLSRETPLINVSGLGANDIGMQCGGWTIEWQGETGDITPGTTILEAIQNTVSEETAVEYNQHGHFEKRAKVCIAVVGEEPYAEGQGDSKDLSLSVADKRMLRRLPEQCGKLVVVLLSGRPLIVTDYLDDWDAFVAAWLPGTEGQGVTDALFGDVPFSGKLPYTWPLSADQLPLSVLAGSGEEPLFPFGYGLTTEGSEAAESLPGAGKEEADRWVLVWSDEFDGDAIDPDNWAFDTGTGSGGWGNAERQSYTDRPENVRVENGHLVIEAREEGYQGSKYTSARLKTQGLQSWTYGRIEARIKIPSGQGIWPAFWMLGENITEVKWPGCGEIDIMENVGKEPFTVHGTLHGPGYSGANGIGGAYQLSGEAFADDFHTFAVEWEPDQVRWYVDDEHYMTQTASDVPGEWVYNQPFFLILNVAVGGHWPGNPDETTVFPQYMAVDYVRVYQNREQ